MGVVAVLEVVDVELVVVGVVVLVDVLVDVEVLVDEEVVEVDAVEAVCCRQSFRASLAIVLAPWVRLRRSVGLIVTGRVRTSLFSATLAFSAAPQLPDVTAEEI